MVQTAPQAIAAREDGTAMVDNALFEDPAGPIEQFSWGKFVICGKAHFKGYEGRVGAGKDIRLVGQEVTPWKERKGHRLKRSMITGVYDRDLDVLVIGNGVDGLVEVPHKVRRDIAAHGIPKLIVTPTPDACQRYNQLHREGKRVGLLAHGTC